MSPRSNRLFNSDKTENRLSDAFFGLRLPLRREHRVFASLRKSTPFALPCDVAELFRTSYASMRFYPQQVVNFEYCPLEVPRPCHASGVVYRKFTVLFGANISITPDCVGKLLGLNSNHSKQKCQPWIRRLASCVSCKFGQRPEKTANQFKNSNYC